MKYGCLILLQDLHFTVALDHFIKLLLLPAVTTRLQG